MTEVGNPELEALSSIQTNPANLLDINLGKSDENGHDENLTLSDKPQIQQVNDDDLLSQINDICGEEQDFPEPKSAISYGKPESLESISEESLPASNTDSLLNDETAAESPAISISKNLPSPIEDDEEMSLLVDDDDDEILEKEAQPLSVGEQSNLENVPVSPPKEDENDTAKEDNSPVSIEDDCSGPSLFANGDDSQSKDVEIESRDENSQVQVEDSEMKDVVEDPEIGNDDSQSKVFVEPVDDSQSKDSLPKDEDSETKTALEEEPNSVQEESNILQEESNILQEELSPTEDVNKESNVVSLEKDSNEEPVSTKEPAEEVADISVVTSKDGEENSIQKESNDDVKMGEGELAKEEENKRKRSVETPEKVGAIKESDAKRLKAAEVAEDSDDDIQFFPVTENTPKSKSPVVPPADDDDEEIEFFPVTDSASPSKCPAPPTETNEDSDEEIVFYKVPPSDADDDDIEIIEETPSKDEEKKQEPSDKKDDAKPVDEVAKVNQESEEVKEVAAVKVEESKTEVAKTSDIPEKPSESTLPAEKVSEDAVVANPKTEKDEDSDDDIMIVEEENPIVSLTEDDVVENEAKPAENVKEAEKEQSPTVVAKSGESEKPTTEKVVEIADKVVEQSEKSKDGADDVEIIQDVDSKSMETASSKETPAEKVEVSKETPKTSEGSDKENLLVDNSDNACDVTEQKDGVTVDLDDAASNCSTSSNLLKCGPKSAMDREREEAYGKAKRMRMSIDNDDGISNLSTDTDVSQAYSSHSLKRSHSNSPTPGDNDDSSSKKSKLSDKSPEKLSVNGEIVKKIHKKLKRMTQKDLESLVLQKIVESINYESKIGNLNEQLEKSHEKLEKFSQQYTNLKKQFNDLQLVHTRVTADLEKRNTSYVMPIKITRAVGLQVSIGTKASAEGRNTYVVSSTNSTTVVKSPVVPSSPLQQPQQQQPSQTPTSSQTPTPATTPIPPPSTPSPASAIRRGCVQKITPKRPVPVKTTTPNSQVVISPVVQASPQPQPPQQPPKLLNRSAPTTPILPKAVIKAPVATPPTQPSLTIANLERNIQKLTANSPIVRHNNVPTSVMKKTAGGGPQPTKSMTPANVMKQLPSSISIQPYASEPASEARPQKGVIDLTDEDDLPQQPTYNGVATRQQTMRPSPQVQITRQQHQQQQQQHQIQQHHQPQQQNIPYVKIAPKPNSQLATIPPRFKHPAPLPRVPEQKSLPHWKPIPPKPIIRINNSRAGIVISWAMEQSIDRFATITNYQIYAYQAPNDIAPSTEHWRYVDVVEAMLLPMAVTLTEFQEGLKYFFSVRAVDEYKRVGPFSLPRTWDSVKNN